MKDINRGKLEAVAIITEQYNDNPLLTGILTIIDEVLTDEPFELDECECCSYRESEEV